MEARSPITHPAGGQRLGDRGYRQIRGIAWSGRGRVERVEVSTDGGRSWRATPVMGTRTVIRECLLIVVLVGGWIVLLPVLAFLFYSPHEGGPIHLMGLLLRDLFVDRRLGVWGLILTPYTVVQLFRLFGAAVGITRSRG